MALRSDIQTLSLQLEQSPVLAEHHCVAEFCNAGLMVHRDGHVFQIWMPASEGLMLNRMGGSREVVLEPSADLALARTEAELMQFFEGLNAMLRNVPRHEPYQDAA